uniref:EOG090X07B6 n=1 Tax=Daphnia similis TaxID=35528 RepID=A0A4Y7N547_9CRUS|nr:EOG090X07B6 [Daphnia similis]
MADGADTRVNLAALKRVDPYAVEIVETGTQVAIYKFNSQSNEWEKTDVEGTLFLYARSGDPRHGFVVMNRLSTENLVEPITRDLEIQLQAPFLLYKNAKLSITGVWFYEESECTRIAQKLEALVKEETERRRPNLVQEKSNVDIMSLLTKAGQEYEQVVKHCIYGKPVSTSSSVDVVRPTALRPASNGGNTQSTPLSVADFLCKLSTTSSRTIQISSPSSTTQPTKFVFLNLISNPPKFTLHLLLSFHVERAQINLPSRRITSFTEGSRLMATTVRRISSNRRLSSSNNLMSSINKNCIAQMKCYWHISCVQGGQNRILLTKLDYLSIFGLLIRNRSMVTRIIHILFINSYLLFFLFSDEAKRLRWENAKLMLENLWKYNMLQTEESACAAVIAQDHH